MRLRCLGIRYLSEWHGSMRGHSVSGGGGAQHRHHQFPASAIEGATRGYNCRCHVAVRHIIRTGATSNASEVGRKRLVYVPVDAVSPRALLLYKAIFEDLIHSFIT